MNVKTSLLQKIFNSVQGSLAADKDFQKFVEENKEWLAPYAAFCQFRDEFKTSDFSKWKGHESIKQVPLSPLSIFSSLPSLCLLPLPPLSLLPQPTLLLSLNPLSLPQPFLSYCPLPPLPSPRHSSLAH